MDTDHLAVTLSSVNGTRHFRLSKKNRSLLKIITGVLLTGITIGACTLYLLLEEIDFAKQIQNTLQNKSNSLSSELKNLEEVHLTLQREFVSKEEDLEKVKDRLGDIESLLGTSPEQLEIHQRLDLAAVNSVVRHQILQQIPNGRPVKIGRFSSPYGKRIHPVTKKATMHRGLDFAVNTGTPVYATADGVVSAARKSNRGSGNYLAISHSFGFTSSFSHLSKFKVKMGDFVKKGDLVAISGNTGLSSGPHLHYEIRFVGRALNPRPFVDWNLNNFESIFSVKKGIKWDYLIKTVKKQVSTTLQLSSQKAPSSSET